MHPRSTLVRRTILFGGPLGYIVLGLVHPMGDLEVGDAAGFYIFLHLVQPLLIALIAFGLWLLVEGSRAPRPRSSATRSWRT